MPFAAAYLGRRAARAATVVLALAGLGACQAGPSAPPTAQQRPDAGALAAEAAALMAAGQYGQAAERYRQAALARPDDVASHFGLGVAYSNLDQRREAAEQFRWVVEHAHHESAEYREASRWLGKIASPGDRAALPPCTRPRPA